MDYPHTWHIRALNGWCVYHYFLINAVGTSDRQNFANKVLTGCREMVVSGTAS